MKLTEAMASAFDAQITLEFEASLVYRQLAIQMDVSDLPGLALWLRRQADEEIVHANKFIDHVVDRDGNPSIGAIKAPAVSTDFSPADAFGAALEHEQRVSESIRDLYRTGEAEGDLDSRPLLNWFLEEQLEEVATVSEILAQIKMVGDDGPGLLRLDADLGSRPPGGTEPV